MLNEIWDPLSRETGLTGLCKTKWTQSVWILVSPCTENVKAEYRSVVSFCQNIHISLNDNWWCSLNVDETSFLKINAHLKILYGNFISSFLFCVWGWIFFHLIWWDINGRPGNLRNSPSTSQRNTFRSGTLLEDR